MVRELGAPEPVLVGLMNGRSASPPPWPPKIGYVLRVTEQLGNDDDKAHAALSVSVLYR